MNCLFSGVITVRQKLDRESQESYNLIITVTDGFHVSQKFSTIAKTRTCLYFGLGAAWTERKTNGVFLSFVDNHLQHSGGSGGGCLVISCRVWVKKAKRTVLDQLSELDQLNTISWVMG